MPTPPVKDLRLLTSSTGRLKRNRRTKPTPPLLAGTGVEIRRLNNTGSLLRLRVRNRNKIEENPEQDEVHTSQVKRSPRAGPFHLFGAPTPGPSLGSSKEPGPRSDDVGPRARTPPSRDDDRSDPYVRYTSGMCTSVPVSLPSSTPTSPPICKVESSAVGFWVPRDPTDDLYRDGESSPPYSVPSPTPPEPTQDPTSEG